MLSNRFTEALTYATQLHANQTRRGSGVPYIAHLLGVASIALEYRANETETMTNSMALTSGLRYTYPAHSD